MTKENQPQENKLDSGSQQPKLYTPEELEKARYLYNYFELIKNNHSLTKLENDCQKYPDLNLIGDSNHTTWPDGLGSALLAEYLRKEINSLKNVYRKINGFNLPIAVSMETGDQGADIQKWLAIFKVLNAEKGLFTIPITRDKDSRLYGIMEKHFGSIKKILRGFDDNYGFMEYVEGNMNGGRYIDKLDPSKGVNGVGKPDPDNATDYLINKFVKKNKNFGVLVYAIDGTCEFFSPELKKITIPDKKIRVVMGDYLTRKDFEDSPFQPSELILRKTVPLLSEKFQGSVYK